MQTPIQHTHRKKKKGGRKEEKRKGKEKKKKHGARESQHISDPARIKKILDQPNLGLSLYYDVINFSLSTKFFNYFYFIFVIRK